VTGYYFFDSNVEYHPSHELETFLDDGDPPVCVSFGSMIHRNAERIDEVVRGALMKTNRRGIILSGWGKVNRESTNELLYLDAVPHDWLLPLCKMLIHHGGAGTTSAGLRAGIPQVVVPIIADQPFWGRRVHTSDVGSRQILVKDLSVERLARSIAEAESKAIRERAQLIGQKIRSEDGARQAIELIESTHHSL